MINNMFAERTGTPLLSRPLYWDTRLPVSANVHVLQDWIIRYSRYLPAGAVIDEAAIMIPPSDFHEEKLRLSLEQNGWRHFNAAEDVVYASPFGTRYMVRYDFFQHPGRTWRLEVMQQHFDGGGNIGFSPLHQALWLPDGRTPTWSQHAEYPVPHLSFKPPAAMAKEMGASKAVRRCIEAVQVHGAIIAQACQSSYGEFWYMLPTKAARQLYLKPRINTRDAV